MGYETLPLAQDSAIPSFVAKLGDVKTLRNIEFCWSDLEIWPIAGMPHARVSYLSADGKEATARLPITKTEWYYPKHIPDGNNPIFITILGKKELYEHVIGTSPRQLRVIDIEEWKRKESVNK